MRGHTIKFLKLDNSESSAARVAELKKKVDISGSTMIGNLNLGNQQIVNLGFNINNNSDVVNLGFCDTKYLQKVSDSDLHLDDHRVKNSLPPVADNDLTTKKYVDDEIAKIPQSGGSSSTQFIRRDGTLSMTAYLDLGGNKIPNLKSPESNNDAVNREYLNQKISEISDKTNVFAYLNNPNQTNSQRNITVNSFGFWNNSPYKYNKRAYDVTLQQHAPPNYYNSIIGFKLNDAGTGKFTIVFEIYTTKISNINISSVVDASTINKETQINLVDHTKLITQINNPSLRNNDYLYYKITGNSTQATIKTHIIVYGVSGWVENIIYYLDNMFEYDNGMKMKTDVNLSNFKISNLKTPTNESDAANKKYIDETLEQSHLLASSKKNEFLYLDSPDDTSSEYNIVVNGFVNNFRESPHRNKKAYDITLKKDAGSNNYRSRMGFNLYPQPLGTYTMIFEFFPPEMTNIDLSVQATSAYIHKQVQKNFSSYSKILVQINNNSKQTPDYIYLTMHGTATATPAQGYLIV